MKKILIIDIETTDFLDLGGKIVEIGMVELNLENGERKIVFDEVCHERPITLKEVEKAWIVKNSDLTVDMIRRSRNLELMRKEVQDIINSYSLGCTAFNNEFDFGFMERKKFVIPKKLACPMKLSTDILKLPGRRPGDYKWPKVQEAWDFFFGKETGYIEKHRGADDAYHEAAIVYELYLRGIFKV